MIEEDKADISGSQLRSSTDYDLKKDWIKVTYLGVTKRIYKAPIEDINELKIFIWNRFKSLRRKVVDPGDL